MQYWPHALGVLLAIILLTLIVVLLWKTKAFSKMRIFRNKMDEAQNQGKQQETEG